MNSVTSLRVDRGSLSAAELRVVLAEVVEAIDGGDEGLVEDLRAADLTRDDLPGMRVEEETQGFDPLSAIVIAFATGVGRGVGTRLWDRVIAPEIKRRRGADSVGDAVE